MELKGLSRVYILLIFTRVITADMTISEEYFTEMETSVSGGIVSEVEVRKYTECANVCSRETSCAFYQFNRLSEFNCILIQKTQGEQQTFLSDDDSRIYQKVHDMIYYNGFEDALDLTMHNGAHLTTGLYGSHAIKTVATNSGWVDFGLAASEACITEPTSCTNGGTVAVWIKVGCSGSNGVLTSWDEGKTGFYIKCWGGLGIRGIVKTQERHYEEASGNGGAWTHMALVYHGVLGGMTMYKDGTARHTGGSAISDVTLGTGQLVLGRCHVNGTSEYTSVQADELSFWNRPISAEEVEALRQ